MLNIKMHPFSDLESIEKITDNEIITPFEIVKKMIELLPKEVFNNPNNKFIDISTKSGIYLKYIFFNLLDKLPNIKILKDNNELDYELDEDYDFNNLEDKKKFILRYMIYGIATSELSFLTSKRTLYENINENEDSEKTGKILSKPIFKNIEGNIIYKKLNNNEYWFLKTDIEEINKAFIKNIKLKENKSMKFNVIIGNPPYQIQKGGNNIMPIYHYFIEKSIELKPDYLSFIIPSRWLIDSSRKEIEKFRKNMFDLKYIKELYDYKDASDCFKSVDIKGGICYFLMGNEKEETFKYTEYDKNNNKYSIETKERFLDEYDILIRDNRGIEILKKVKSRINVFLKNTVSSQEPFIASKDKIFDQYKSIKKENIIEPILFYGNNNKYKDGIGFIPKNKIQRNNNLIEKHKVFIPKAFRELKNKAFYGEKNSICTETYLVVNYYETKEECINLIEYLNTDLVSFLVKLRKVTQNSTKDAYGFVPILDMHTKWNDKRLYEYFNISKEEQEYIKYSIETMAKLI